MGSRSRDGGRVCMDNGYPKVDVVIPRYKPDEKYDKLIDRLTKQTIKPNHIYVMNTVSGKETADEELKHQEVENLTITNLPKAEFDHGGTRNQGAAMSDAEFIMMMTQDAVPADKYLIERMMKCFKDEKVAAVYARQLATPEVGIVERYTRVFNYPEEDVVKSKEDLERLGIKTFFCSNVCCIYRKSIYEELGGFVTKTIFNEDMIMASCIIDAGYSIAYAAKAKVFHAHRYTCQQQFQRNFDLGVSHRQYYEIFSRVRSEKEGVSLVKKTIHYLWKQGEPLQILDLVMQSGCKFLGYRMGKMYHKLPLWLIRMCSSQKEYWDKGKE